MATVALRNPTVGAVVHFTYNYPFSYNNQYVTYEYSALTGESDLRFIDLPSANLRDMQTQSPAATLRDRVQSAPTANLRKLSGAQADLRQR